MYIYIYIEREREREREWVCERERESIICNKCGRHYSEYMHRRHGLAYPARASHRATSSGGYPHRHTRPRQNATHCRRSNREFPHRRDHGNWQWPTRRREKKRRPQSAPPHPAFFVFRKKKKRQKKRKRKTVNRKKSNFFKTKYPWFHLLNSETRIFVTPKCQHVRIICNLSFPNRASRVFILHQN